MPGPLPKPDGRRQRRNSRQVVSIGRGAAAAPIPPAPKGLLVRTRDKWAAYWRSAVASAIEIDSDMPAIERLFLLYDERTRAHESVRKRPLVVGSQGQPVLNPLNSVIARCDSEIRALEDRLGMNPQSRLRLGLKMAEAAGSLNDLMSDMAIDDEDEDEEEIEEESTATQKCRRK